VIVYCSCPNEVSSARVALVLHRKGVTRVRPLLGGIDAWRELNYPLAPASRPPKSVTPIQDGAAAQSKPSNGANLRNAA
jgi:3-mercaptopyruvate sulfurtransferase SseA